MAKKGAMTRGNGVTCASLVPIK